jgi:hypothetical protein
MQAKKIEDGGCPLIWSYIDSKVIRVVAFVNKCSRGRHFHQNVVLENQKELPGYKAM